MKLQHPQLVDLLQMAYSAEKAAAFAYQGNANAVKDEADKIAIRQIEQDEWNHRIEVFAMMQQYEVPVSRYYEWRFHVVGKVIAFSCHVIGWFMPFYFAGRLESGNVCEYFRMKRYFNQLGITQHDEVLYEMGMKEKEHEIYFLDKVKHSRLLPFFEKVFSWGASESFNNVNLDRKYSLEETDDFCPTNRSSGNYS